MIRDLSRNLRVRSILSQCEQEDPETGDLITVINTHEIHVTADEILLQNDLGTPYRASMIDVIADINTSGANGLDSGTKSPSTWYYLWIISDAMNLVKGLISTSPSNPILPGCYSYKAYVGAIYNNQSNYFTSYYQNEKLAWADKSCPIAMMSFPTTPTIVDLSDSIPSTARSVILELSCLTTIGGNFISNISVGPTSSGPWHNQWMMVAGTPQGAGAIDHLQSITQCEVLIDKPQNIYAYVGTQNDRLEIHVLGWRY